MKRLAISLVLYNNRAEEVAKLAESIRASTLTADLFVIDNSPLDHAALFESCENAHYARNEKNTGYGAGHNLVLKNTLASYDYHLVVNPDIFFDPQVLERIVGFMDEHPEIGHLMPKVLYPDGRIQYLCKNLPRPWHLIARRILPPRLAARWNDRYEMRYADYNRIMDVPFLSGCFMFLRCAALREVGLFDERYFLYFEDLDLTRRITRHFRCVYYPEVFVYHNHKNENYRNMTLLYRLIQSGVRYFNRYGWRPLW